MNFLISFIFIVVDFITGIIKAIKEKTFTSSIMREGLYHKCGSIIIIVVAYLVDYSQKYIDLGFKAPIITAVCVYIILMEIGSIIENVGKINPNILPDKIRDIFAKL